MEEHEMDPEQRMELNSMEEHLCAWQFPLFQLCAVVYLFVFLFFLFSPSRYVFCGPKAPVGVFHEEQSTVLHLLLQEEGNQGHMYI
jgi:hypothetical protein